MKKSTTRRQFIKNSALASSFMIVPRHVLGGLGFTAPSDKINIGFIGTGRQARGLHSRFLDTGLMQTVAACDVYAGNLKHFTERVHSDYAAKTSQETYNGCKCYDDFQELLAQPDLDAVVIATPDHWHGVQAVRAAEAGKDIYLEKPVSLTIKEGRAIVKAVKKHDLVFQTGSMQRSAVEFRHAVELVRNGYLGEIKTVKVSVGPPPEVYNLPAEPVPDGLNWDFWLGPNSYVPYNHQLVPSSTDNFWARWRYFKDLGGGALTDWGAHMFDIAHWALDKDKGGPVEIIPPDGKQYPFLTFRYADGITVTHENFGKNNAVRFVGSEGELDIQRGNLETTPVSLKDNIIGPDEKRVYRSDNHYKDWLDAIGNRTEPICDVETGHRSASIGNLGLIAYEVQRPLKWDPVKETFTNDRVANSLLGREMREKWAITL
ncbi:MAG: Gfo/Idh/MocA family oxidoreductase [Balneolales bacterium]